MSRWRLLAAKIADWVSTSLIGVFSAVRGAFPDAPEPPIGVLSSLHANLINGFVPLTIALFVIALGSKVVQELLGSQSKVRLKALLDALHSSYFADVPDSERYYSRVTLFKANTARDRLKHYCRSGTQFQRSRTSFRIDDDDEAANEGVAGSAWFKDATLTLNDLPSPSDPWDDSHESCKAYAEAGYLSPEKASKLKVKSRSILATPVRSFSGVKWGVLVVDSRTPGSMVSDREFQVALMATAIGKMV